MNKVSLDGRRFWTSSPRWRPRKGLAGSAGLSIGDNRDSAFADGDRTEVVARIVTDNMAGWVAGQDLVIENVVGAAARPASPAKARQKNDGYTIAMGHWGRTRRPPALFPTWHRPGGRLRPDR